MPRKTKEQREMLGVMRRTRRSGAYTPNATNTGIVKAGKSAQQEHRTRMNKAIKGLKRGL